MITTRDRYRGSLVGVLAGDALGAPYETSRKNVIRMDWDSRGGLVPYDYVEPFKHKREIKAGQPTDDSELTAAVAQSMARPNFTEEDLYYRLRGFIFGHGSEGRKSILTSDEPFGSGGTLRSALRAVTYKESFYRFRIGQVRVLPTNGSLMRNAPVALRAQSFNELIALAERQSCVTHIHPRAQVACIVHAILHHHLLYGIEPQEAWHQTLLRVGELEKEERATKDKILLRDFQEVSDLRVNAEPKDDDIWPESGEVFLSLRVAVWALLAAQGFREGITKAVSVGGDTDTYAAIAGSLLGARFGIEGIPPEWRSVLRGREIMDSLATQLYELSHT